MTTRPRRGVGGWRAERAVAAGDHGGQWRLDPREKLRLDKREANSRSWRGRTEGQSTPDTEQRGEEAR